MNQKQENNQHKKLTGTVVSVKMNKTVIVAVVQITTHPKYKKTVKKTKRFAAHNDTIDLSMGDKVIITEAKPMSHTKHFVVTEKLSGV